MISNLSDVHRFQLPNGLTLLIHEDPTVPVVSSMLWYRVGSRHEQRGTTGLSHFLEHMMFKGTELFEKGEIDLITARNGGFNNAFTSFDYTAYYFSFASDRWPIALRIEADRMVHNQFDPAEFELERQVILEELKMELDSPWGELRQAVELSAFQSHPYRYPVIGLPEDVSCLTLDQMLDHYRKFYAPDNAVLVLAGDLNTEESAELVTSLFSAIPARAGVQPKVPVELPRSAPVRLELERPSPVARLLLALPAPSVFDPHHYTAHVLEKVLAEGKLSRLYRRLVEQEQIASFVDVEWSETHDPHLMQIRVELNDGAAVGTAEQILFEELEALSSSPPEPRELTRARNLCISEHLSDLETTFDQCYRLGLMEVFGRPEEVLHYVERIEAVGSEAIADLVRALGSPQQAIIGVQAAG